MGPGNVRIEEGPPQLQGGAMPPPLPQGHGAHHQGQQGAFAPQPPADVRRSGRAPYAPGDFAAPAQHGYHPDSGEGYRAEPQPQPPREQRRRMGLFERITGRARNATDSDTRQPANAPSYHREHQERHGAPHAEQQYAPFDERGAAVEQGAQEAELPVFFKERRK
jgi:cell division protein FtsZ